MPVEGTATPVPAGGGSTYRANLNGETYRASYVAVTRGQAVDFTISTSTDAYTVTLLPRPQSPATEPPVITGGTFDLGLGTP